MAGSTPVSLSAVAPVPLAAKAPTRRFSPWREAWRRYRRHKLAVASSIVLLLLIAHYIIVVRFDLNPLYLRGVSMLVPIPFGFALRFFYHNGLRGAAVFGVITGILAVAGMLTVVGITDKVAIIPETARDWRETIEYMASIALAGITGSILAMVALRLLNKSMSSNQQPNPAAVHVAKLLWPHIGSAAMRRRAEKVETIMETVMASGAAIGTAAGSVYTGVRALLPNLL